MPYLAPHSQECPCQISRLSISSRQLPSDWGLCVRDKSDVWVGSHEGWSDGRHPRWYARRTERDGDPPQLCKEILHVHRVQDLMDLVRVDLLQDAIPLLTVYVQGCDSING